MRRTLEELISLFIDYGTKAYKKMYNGEDARKLTRHEPVEINGVEFTCWREFSTYKMAEHIADKFRGIQPHVYLNGNDSVLEIETSPEEQEEIRKYIEGFLSENDLL